VRVRVIATLVGLATLGVEGGSLAQEPAAPVQEAPAATSDQPLSAKYRFIESYGPDLDLGRPDLLVQYKVGSIETIRTEVEKARGAPARQEIEYRTIYTERPAQLGRLGEVTDAVRHYDVFRAGGAAQADPRMAMLLRGLKLWYHPRAGTTPELISLNPDRLIRQLEYDNVLNQIFFPRLTAIFPPRPVRKADTWTLTRAAAQALVGQVPEAADFRLEATLTQVERAAQGTVLTAIIDISGVVNLDAGEGAVRARLWFVFEPLAATPAASPRVPSGRPGTGGVLDPEIVEARGFITKVHMTRRLSSPVDEDGRLQQIVTRELQVQRRKTVGAQGSPETDLLTIPKPPPTADEKNSWLLYDDSPQGRFHLRHPQELAVQLNEPDALVLHSVRKDGKSDTVIIGDVPREADPALDRKWTDPQAFVRNIQQNSERRGYEVITGPTGWLPEQDWAPLKRRVYRYEAALKRDDGSRLYLDGYLVLFARGDHFVIQAFTEHNEHVAFRNQAEGIIRSLELGPSDPAMAGTSGQLAPDRPSAPPPSPDRPSAPPPSPDRPSAPPVPRLDRRP
jgi:hypothetical protein